MTHLFMMLCPGPGAVCRLQACKPRLEKVATDSGLCGEFPFWCDRSISSLSEARPLVSMSKGEDAQLEETSPRARADPRAGRGDVDGLDGVL